MGNFAYTKSRRKSPTDADTGHFLAEPLPAAEEHATAANTPPATSDAALASHDFGQIAVEPAPANAPQMKLRLSQPEDTHEQEANAVADEVMRMPAPPTSPAADAADAATTTASASMSDALPDAAGQPLDTTTRAYMEPRFGHDFGQIRIHTDEQAATSAADFGARAYTVGSDIVFGAGEYVPDTATGRHLIAHELTHVVQQGGGSAPAGTVHREPEGGTAVHEPEAAPDDAASSLAQDIGATADIRPKDDIKIIHDIIRDQVHVIDAWTAGLTDFKAALDSSPDKVPTSSYFGAIAKIMTESGFGLLGENLGMIVEIGEAAVNPMELAAKVGLAIVEEYNKGKEAAEVEERNKAKVAVSDFFTLHNDRFTELKKVTVDAEEKLSEYVGAKRDAASASLKRKSRKHSGGKHSW